jgi:hypothetical protein
MESTQQATFARIYSETNGHLDRHLARVKEGRDVDAACFFARWLFWSGLLDLLKQNSTPADMPSILKCDGAFLSWKLNELLGACNAYYATGRPAGLHVAELESLREKVDKLALNLDTLAGAMVQLLQRLPAPAPADLDEGDLPPAPRVAGSGGESPSLSESHNCIEAENKSSRFEIPESAESARVVAL